MLACLEWLRAHNSMNIAAHGVERPSLLNGGWLAGPQVHYMVAAEPASADEMMWRNLRNKLNVVGRVIDGHAQGGAAGDCFLQACSLAAPRP